MGGYYVFDYWISVSTYELRFMIMINANELRLGNYHLYHFIDKYDERKEWVEIYTIDPYDIQMLADKIDVPYNPVPLTKDWLIKAHFRECEGGLYLLIPKIKMNFVLKIIKIRILLVYIVVRGG